jgi:hypothetical protein
MPLSARLSSCHFPTQLRRGGTSKYAACFITGLAWLTATALVADDSAKLEALLADAAGRGGIVTIPPGDYSLDGLKPLALRSGMTVCAYGAHFHLPERLGDKARIVLFSGEDICDFSWFGGHFTGCVFDPAKVENTWEPNVNTRLILITTSAAGRTENLTFRDITSDGVAGAVISVFGKKTKQSARFAHNVTVENCTLQRSGRFMWDYGYLWQLMVWPEEHSSQEREIAEKYFRNDLVRGPVRMADGDDRVFFHNTPCLPVSKKPAVEVTGRGHQRGDRDSVCFFGDTLPANIVRGKQYYVVASEPGFIRIAESHGGSPIRFAASAGPNARLIHDLYTAHYAIYSPTGSGPGKGAIDLMVCKKATVRGCRLSALGDAMHIAESEGVIFADNHISGARMGAFFLAHYCKDATITGNTVDGTNGSRVLSVEMSCEDVTIVGNTFRNGGRGSWINQPRNLVLADNIFINNTTKCDRDPRHGRRSFLTGDYETYAEVYFARYQPEGRYGNIIVKGNLFVSGDNATHAITFAPGGDSILVTDNVFGGKARDVIVSEGCENVTVRSNMGIDPADR